VAQGYVERVLVPGEKVLYWGKVTWVMYMPGTIFCLLALAAAKYLPDLERKYYTLYRIDQWLAQYLPVEHAAEAVTFLFFVVGIYYIIRAYIICNYTELAVTDKRVISKMGVFDTITTEIDRHKIAGVIISQTLNGKIYNYGKIVLRGYSGHISGLPPISKPYDFQKLVNSRMR